MFKIGDTAYYIGNPSLKGTLQGRYHLTLNDAEAWVVEWPNQAIGYYLARDLRLFEVARKRKERNLPKWMYEHV